MNAPPEPVLVPTPPSDRFQVAVAFVKNLVHGLLGHVHGDELYVVKAAYGLVPDAVLLLVFY